MSEQDNLLDRAVAALKNLEASLETAIDSQRQWVADLEEFMQFLDKKFPRWRKSWKSRK